MKLYALWYPSAKFLVSPGLFGPPVFIPERQLHLFGCVDDPGHRSHMLFDERHVDFAHEHPGIWNGRQFPQFSNFLFIDVDDHGLDSVAKLESLFAKYDYLIYASGGDCTYHFIVPHNLISDMDLGKCYRLFMATANVGHDPSVYSPLCGMAMPGCVNSQTGRRKTLIKCHDGEKFRFDDVSPEAMQEFGRQFFRGLP